MCSPTSTRPNSSERETIAPGLNRPTFADLREVGEVVLNRRMLRQVHRWMGLVVGIQLMGWTISGLYFTLIPINEIRGNHLLKPAAHRLVRHARLLSPNDIVRRHDELSDITIGEIQLRQRLDRPVYLVEGEAGTRAYDAESGERLGPLTELQAIAAANGRSVEPVASVAYVDSVAPDAEYRGGELPAWRASLADNTHIYIGANSGRLRAVRTIEWRIFDWFWALHILDFEERDDFNHWLIQFVAALGVISVLTGFVLFFVTLRPLRPRSNSQDLE